MFVTSSDFFKTPQPTDQYIDLPACQSTFYWSAPYTAGKATRLILLLAGIDSSEQPWAVTQHPLDQKPHLKHSRPGPGWKAHWNKRTEVSLSFCWGSGISEPPFCSFTFWFISGHVLVSCCDPSTLKASGPKHVPCFMDLCWVSKGGKC